MHSLLQGQLKRHFGSVDAVPEELKTFLEAIGKAYEESDADRALLERSADLTSQELLERNQQLSRQEGILERLIQERTASLERRSVQLQVATEVARAIASVQNLDQLLPSMARLISERFGFYHVGLFLLDPAREYAVLQAANSEGGQRMLARGHRLKVGQVGIVGYVTGAGLPRIALDVGQDAVFFDNPALPHTRSEMALPLKVGEEVIGALDAQSTLPAAFSKEDAAILGALADQVAIAIQNARLFDQTQAALEAARRLVQREHTIAAITDRIHGATDVKSVLRIAAEELRRATGSTRAVVRLSRDLTRS